MPAKKIPIGVDDFSELVSKARDYLFVDKTLLIKELIDDGVKVSLIIRPRRWGKTINMSMLKYFFAPEIEGHSTAGLFDDLKIAKEADGAYLRHQGKNPVILLTFKGVKEDSFDAFMANISLLMSRLYREYRDILIKGTQLADDQRSVYFRILDRKADQADLQNALQFLSECLEQHYHHKVIILIDEYDTPLNCAYEKDYFEKAVGFFKNLLGASLKGNSALEKGVMTGILRLSKNSMLSDLNNLGVYSLMDEEYSRYFGFSEDEVKQLFLASGVSVDFSAIQKWYNGYHSGHSVDIYNPWSILNCMKKGGALGPYWIKTGDESLLARVFIESDTAIKEKLNVLISGGAIESTIDDYVSFNQIESGKEEVLWSLLWALGYLKTVGEPFGTFHFKRYHLMIPNDEVASSYRTVFIQFICSLKSPDQYHNCISHLIKGEVEAFASDLQAFMLHNVSYFDCVNESSYHMLILGMSAYLKETHTIISNLEQGTGRVDLILSPSDSNNTLGIIIEFKRSKTDRTPDYYEQLATVGLQQIDEKHYDVQLKSNTQLKQILKLCLVFQAKKFFYKFVIESIPS